MVCFLFQKQQNVKQKCDNLYYNHVIIVSRIERFAEGNPLKGYSDKRDMLRMPLDM